MIPITPAGIGFAEAVLVVVSGILSLDNPVNILAAGLNRSAMLLVSLTLGPIFTFILSRKSGLFLFVFRRPDQNEGGDKQP